MKINKVSLVYFSTSGNTKKICEVVGKSFGKEITVYDRTPFENRWSGATFGEEELVIIGMPSYYGRAPKIINEFFRYIKGNNTPAIFITTYGNREFEDTLLEIKNESEKRGFIGVGAGAFIGEHNMTAKLGSQRPDKEDEEVATNFALQIKNKLEELDDLSNINLNVSGNYPYKYVSEPPVAPSTNEDCGDCMACQKNCPMLAISPQNPRVVDGFRCINCGRCIRNCPKKAKYIGVEKINDQIKIIEAMNSGRKDVTTFTI